MEKDSVSSKFDFSIQSISITADQQKLVAGSSGSIIVLPLKFLTAQEKIRKNQLETLNIQQFHNSRVFSRGSNYHRSAQFATPKCRTSWLHHASRRFTSTT